MTMTTARIVLLADGKIGQQIVHLALEHDPSVVCGLVSLPGDEAGLQLARDFNIAYVVYDDRRLYETAQAVRQLKANIVLLAWWPRILNKDFLNLGQDFTLNLHPSLLPYGRGKDPNFWALVEESPFGVTIHHVSADVDAGDIAFQREIAYGWEDTGESLYRKASEAAIDLFRECYQRIVNFDIPRQAQDISRGTFHKRQELEARSFIDLDRQYTARELLNLLRARTFQPHPACRFADGAETYEIRVVIRRIA
jgi:methionyl-tRNA formyltransferase